jgi:hypothetical protein
MKVVNRAVTVAEAERLGVEYDMTPQQASEWFYAIDSYLEPAWVENKTNFADEAVRNCNTNPRRANTVADAQVEPIIAKTKETQ